MPAPRPWLQCSSGIRRPRLCIATMRAALSTLPVQMSRATNVSFRSGHSPLARAPHSVTRYIGAGIARRVQQRKADRLREQGHKCWRETATTARRRQATRSNISRALAHAARSVCCPRLEHVLPRQNQRLRIGQAHPHLPHFAGRIDPLIPRTQTHVQSAASPSSCGQRILSQPQVDDRIVNSARACQFPRCRQSPRAYASDDRMPLGPYA